jgi:hypothetical protein
VALSGTIWGSFTGVSTDRVRPYINWSATQYISGGVGYSTVTATLVFVKYNATYGSNNSSFSNTAKIDTNTHTTNSSFDLRPVGTAPVYSTVRSREVTVTHNSDGTKNCYIGWSGNTGTSLGSFDFGTTVSLDTITQASAVTTNSATSVTSNSATANGNVTTAGIPANTDRGIYWGTSSSSQPYKISTGSGGTGAFTVSMTSLSPNTTYYYKAYSYNSSHGYSYGSVVSFTTLAVAPTLTTSAMSNIYSTKATANASITNIYGANATRRGFCYMTGTSGDPTTSNNVVYEDGSFGTGSYSKVITGLSPSTNYRVRPYAVNSAGTGYGTTVQLTTLTNQHTLSISDTIKEGEFFDPTLAFRLGEIRLIGAYGGWYVGSNYWAGSFENYLFKVFSDQVKVRESGSNIFKPFRKFVESLKLSEIYTKGFVRVMSLLDSITISSGVERLYELVRGWAESIGITDTFKRTVANVRKFAEGISLSEAFTTVRRYVKSLAESIVASDIYRNTIRKVLKSPVIIADGISKTAIFVRGWFEDVVITEAFNIGTVLLRIFKDTISLADNILQIYGRYFVDTINVVENWWKAFVIKFVDSIGLEDVLGQIGRTYSLVLAEVLNISDFISKGAKIIVESLVKIVDTRPVRILNGVVINWTKSVRKVLEWAGIVKKKDEYLNIEKKLNDWELREKDLGLYESEVKPLDEWIKLRREK